MKKKKIKYAGGSCPHCFKDDIFEEITHIQIVLEYAKSRHCCYNCASKALQKNIKNKLQSDDS